MRGKIHLCRKIEAIRQNRLFGQPKKWMKMSCRKGLIYSLSQFLIRGSAREKGAFLTARGREEMGPFTMSWLAVSLSSVEHGRTNISRYWRRR